MLDVRLEADMFRKRHRGRHFFPFWIFFVLFFVFMGKSGFWAWMFPFFLFWIFGPMLWGLSSGGRKWDEQKWKARENPIPAQWQPLSPSQPVSPRETSTPKKVTVVSQSAPLRSMAGLANSCAACGGPVNPTTVEWRTNTPHCGYCGTSLR